MVAERAGLTGQASQLEDEAQALLNDGEMGDARFDDEGGEGDGMAVERDRVTVERAEAADGAHDRHTGVQPLHDSGRVDIYL